MRLIPLRKMLLLCGLLLYLSTGCRWGKQPSSTVDALSSAQLLDDKTDALFVVFAISKDSLSPYSVLTVVDSMRVLGLSSRKLYPEDHDQSLSDCLQILISTGSTLIYEQHIEHPLFRSVEYLEDGTFKRVDVVSSREEFFIRVPISPSATELKIIEIRRGMDKKELIKLQFRQ